MTSRFDTMTIEITEYKEIKIKLDEENKALDGECDRLDKNLEYQEEVNVELKKIMQEGVAEVQVQQEEV